MKGCEISLLRGPSFLLTVPCEYHGLKEQTMSPSKRYAKKHAKARQRRRLQAHERLARERRQAPQAAAA
jgi:hypothetical protein